MLKKLLALSMVVAFAFGLAACEQLPEGLTDVQKLDEAVADLTIPTEFHSINRECKCTGVLPG